MSPSASSAKNRSPGFGPSGTRASFWREREREICNRKRSLWDDRRSSALVCVAVVARQSPITQEWGSGSGCSWMFANTSTRFVLQRIFLNSRENGKYVSVCAANMLKNCDTLVEQWTGIAQSAQRLPTAWEVRGSNPDGNETFRNPSRPAVRFTQTPVQWVPGLSRGKAALGWRLPPTQSSSEVKERVELHLHPFWTFVVYSRVNFTFTFTSVEEMS